MPTPAQTGFAFFGACLLTQAAHAGRPLATEDAGTNSQGQCQLEAWMDKSSGVRHGHLAPACGLLDGLELGLDLDAPSPASVAPRGLTVALKWAPEWLTWHGWRFGAKLSTNSEKAPGETDRHQADLSARAIATYQIDDQWTVHLNLGHARDKLTPQTATSYGGALAYAVNDRLQLFAEWTGDNKTPATRGAGARWWLIPEKLGLDLTYSQGNATPDSKTWGIGLGWYGLHF